MKVLIDKYGRQLNYLRLSVTDRCNFRCYYCMPEEGMRFAHRKDLLSIDELIFLTSIFFNLGISKIRITGGEPFVRPGLNSLLHHLSTIDALDEISITTNGSFNERQLRELKTARVKQVNVSLDSLDRNRFYTITRRDAFDGVYANVFKLLDEGFFVKINCVVTEGKNIQDIIPFVELTKQHNLSVRFLEEMPFNGGSSIAQPVWDYKLIYSHINNHYSQIEMLDSETSSTSVNYKIEGYKGTFGIIPSFSRTFCGTCNRIRLSATGELRTCLYGPPVSNLKDVLRSGASIEELEDVIIEAVAMRVKNGFEAEAMTSNFVNESMSVLGG